MRKDKTLTIQMRRQEKTYNEINRLLGTPKSTLSGWFKGLKIPLIIKRRLWTNNQRKWAQSITIYNKKRALDIFNRNNEIQQRLSKEMGRLTKRELMLIGTALYWAEGDKKARWRCKFSNSDPEIIKIIMNFFRNLCKVPENKFRAYIQIHPNISEQKAKVFWSKISGIPFEQFDKTLTSISKSSKFKRLPNTLPYGTFSVRISNVNLVNRIKGWILGLSKV
jgi:hypothetical protein